MLPRLARHPPSVLMQIWMKRKRSIRIVNSELLVRAQTQPQLSRQVLLLITCRALLRPTTLLATKSAELLSESMLPQVENQASPSEDEYSFQMLSSRINDAENIPFEQDKLSDTKTSEYDNSLIKYTNYLTTSTVLLRHNRFHKHFNSHNYVLLHISY